VKKAIRLTLFCILAAVLLFPSGCAINPVTGSRELAIVSEAEELHIGSEHYGSSRQMQGGDYTLDPRLSAYVNSVGQKLAAASDRSLPYEFVVLNNSTPNAWALPGGKLAVNRGLLLELKSEAELAAVLGHEIVHAAARHGAKGMERGMLLQGALLATGVAFAGHDYVNQIVGGAQLAATLINQKYSRDAEREADTYGMTYMSRAGYDPRAAIGLQETFVRLSKERRQDWLTGLFASHPPSQERVARNRETARLLSAGGIRGEKRYRNAIAGLMKTKDAYAAHDKGRTSFRKGDMAQATKLAQEAIALEPRESRFHCLLGDIAAKQHRHQKALLHYNNAMTRDDSFFYFYLQRGLTRLELRDRSGARTDLERSLKLLPTATAYNALGDIALAQGNRQAAESYYRSAAGSDSEAGRNAQRSLTKLDLPVNPNRYIRVQPGMSSNGYGSADIQNASTVPIGGIRLLIRYLDTEGRARQITRPVPGIIAPGRAVRIPLGIGPFSQPEQFEAIRITVVSAKIVETDE